MSALPAQSFFFYLMCGMQDLHPSVTHLVLAAQGMHPELEDVGAWLASVAFEFKRVVQAATLFVHERGDTGVSVSRAELLQKMSSANFSEVCSRAGLQERHAVDPFMPCRASQVP